MAGTVDPGAVSPGGFVGGRVRRSEDRRLVTGEADYVDDRAYARAGHLAILRSPHGHARTELIDTAAAEDLQGVYGVFTDDDLRASGIDGLLPTDQPDDGVSPDYPILARETVRYQGQPVAAVVAEDRYLAADAVEQIEVEYERLPAVADPDDARDGDVTIHAAAPDNIGFRGHVGDPEATQALFDTADRVVSCAPTSNRVIPSAMESRGAVAEYVPSSGKLSVTLSHQKPHQVREDLAAMLDLPVHRVRVRVPDVGGAFGAKNQQYAGSVLAAWCAMQLGRPVCWRATRTEDYRSTIHAREQTAELEAAIDADGRLSALRGSLVANLGAYLPYGDTRMPMNTAGIITGPYQVDAIDIDVTGVFTNTVPLASYRGAGRPEAIYFLERLVRAAATELGVDPAAFRRRNFPPPEAFPFEAPTGLVYEDGAYDDALTRALEAVDYDQLRERQAALRERGRYLGIGLSCYVDRSGGRSGDWEGGLIRMNSSGSVVAMVGTKDNGHGHETTFAQIVADELGVPFEAVEVVEGDTDRVPEGRGTGGSRSASMGGNALRSCARTLVERARPLAAAHLEAAPEDLEFTRGEFRVRGAPDRAVHLQQLAAEAYAGRDGLPPGVEPGLEETTYFSPSGRTFPFGTHVAVVEVDPETGSVSIERYVAVDDCGTRLNPALVEGQLHGGIAQGIGQAAYEAAVYGASGALQTGSMMDYTLPRAHHLPDLHTEALETPAANNPLGVKGVGESGTIGATPTVVNAVLDALEPFGVERIDMPVTPERVWRAIHRAG